MSHDELQRRAASLHVAAETHEGTHFRRFWCHQRSDEDIFRSSSSPLIFTGQKFLDLGQNRQAKVQFPQRPARFFKGVSGNERVETEMSPLADSRLEVDDVEDVHHDGQVVHGDGRIQSALWTGDKVSTAAVLPLDAAPGGLSSP